MDREVSGEIAKQLEAQIAHRLMKQAHSRKFLEQITSLLVFAQKSILQHEGPGQIVMPPEIQNARQTVDALYYMVWSQVKNGTLSVKWARSIIEEKSAYIFVRYILPMNRVDPVAKGRMNVQTAFFEYLHRDNFEEYDPATIARRATELAEKRSALKRTFREQVAREQLQKP